ncbi:MAG: hypothetical protein IT269_07530 [Saprospiraceae bacterium]|nr:hypothetical protein [Saprospiraceae bacterium]
MLRLAHEYRADIADWETFVFAIFYHDAVYNVLKTDNEARSAALASKRLTQLGFPVRRIELCQNWIRATQKHELSDDPTCNLLLDIDLSVLGADWDIYLEYTRQVRREYAIYPDLIFIPGRRKVLEHFLQQDHIYKTPDFRTQSEARARENLQRELQLI